MKQKKIVNHKIIVIVGPTASGKTDLARKLIKKFNGEVISADSRQIYRGMDLGTGKDKSFLQHMIDIRNPNDDFSVAEYQSETYKIIDDIISKNKIPFLVGGTGLYINSIIYGYQIPKTDFKLRQKIEKFSDKKIINELKKIDPLSYEKNKNNRRRMIRALEVFLLTKRPLSSYKNIKPNFNFLMLGVNLPRGELYQKIDKRVDNRIKEGMIEEVEALNKSGVSHGRLQQFGLEYKYISEYLQGITSLEEMIQKLKFKIHAYARRQITWFRKNKEIIWIKNIFEAEKQIQRFLNEKK